MQGGDPAGGNGVGEQGGAGRGREEHDHSSHAGGGDPRPGSAGDGPGDGPNTQVAELAWNADYRFYSYTCAGNEAIVTMVLEMVTTLMNIIYVRDTDLCHSVSAIVINTTQVYSSSAAPYLLCEFRARWNTVHAAIPRDVAHLATAKNLDGNTIGIAWTGAGCNAWGSGFPQCPAYGNHGYGLSQLGEDGAVPIQQDDIALVAHETGHNWGAHHCDQGGGHCNSNTNPCNIMCATAGQCSGNITSFSTASATCIIDFAASHSCFDTGCDNCSGAAVYVGVSPWGLNDISDAVDAVPCGTTIWIDPDTYHESSLSTTDGPIRLKRYGNSGVVRITP